MKPGYKMPVRAGRPADVQVMQDGALPMSDDRAGVMYRIHYNKAPRSSGGRPLDDVVRSGSRR